MICTSQNKVCITNHDFIKTSFTVVAVLQHEWQIKIFLSKAKINRAKFLGKPVCDKVKPSQ